MWTLDIDKLKVVGEFTTTAGPWNNDWFLVFADKSNEWFEVPFEASSKQFWSRLSQKVNQELIPGLAASVTYASRVIYPKELVGKGLFRLTSLGENLSANQQQIAGLNEVNVEFTNQVKDLFS
ncbi:hypothetical protein [Hymenobacter roseosalivarius]|uniref:hypothetical protein n=1 Tax=Hymenobacter roseosalivarius TaxID=89967 RepID=UPI00117AB609|nr:hypothetical protein [Hymenobacter roseosalivarius]